MERRQGGQAVVSVKRYKCDMTSTEAGHLPLLSLAVEPYTCAPEGEYVLHSDYETLKAEVKRLEQESAKWRRAEHAVGDKCIEFAKTIQTLKAENERLRKAGDAMEEWVGSDECPNPMRLKSNWNAAKEGKPSV